MKISAVVLAYNQPQLLRRTVDCLLAQTAPLHEIIAVDNGSPVPLRVPDGAKLLRIEQPAPNCGTSDAKNAGAAAATGDWLLFTYHDTLHLPDAVKSVVRRAKRLDRQDVLINVLAVPVRTEPSLPTEQSLYQQTAECDSEMIRATLAGGRGGLCFEQHCGLINRDFFLRIGGYDTQHFQSWGLNDQDLCLSVIRHGGILDCDVRRANGQPLFCFHQFDPANPTTANKAALRDAEFKAKYGYNWEDAWTRRWAFRQLANKEKQVASFLQ